MRNDVTTLLAALTAERDSLNRAIEALSKLSDAPKPPTEKTNGRGWKKGRKFSAAHRRAMSEAQQARWAQRRAKETQERTDDIADCAVSSVS